MANRVYLHIGAPKSGTTFLQTILWANRDHLASAKMLLPGAKKFDHNIAAVWVRSSSPRDHVERTWQRMSSEVHAWDGDALFSNEWFSMARRGQARALVDALAPAEVHVVFTARHLLDTVPAAWQETLKLGLSSKLSTFAAGLDTTKDPRWSWETLDPSTVLRKWSDVPPERIHVVTMPPRGSAPDLLWQRFAAAVNLDPAVCDLNQGVTNESLSAEGARLLQLYGPQLRAAVKADQGAWNIPYRWIRDYLSHQLLVPRPGHRIILRDSERRQLDGRINSSIAGLADAGYVVHGELSDLSTWVAPEPALHPDNVPDHAVLELAGAVIPAMLGRLHDQDQALRDAKARAAKDTTSQVEPAPATHRTRDIPRRRRWLRFLRG